MEEKTDNIEKYERTNSTLSWVVTILFIVGIMMVAFSVETTTYPTNEYWVAKDYHHVYEIYSGEIVDTISDNEKVVMKEEEIIVKEYNTVVNTIGWVITVFFGVWIIILICRHLNKKGFVTCCDDL